MELLSLPGTNAPHVYMCACSHARLLPQSCQYPNLSEGADSVSGQLLTDIECPFIGIINLGRVWRKVPESDAWSVLVSLFWELSVITSECVCVCGGGGGVLRVIWWLMGVCVAWKGGSWLLTGRCSIFQFDAGKFGGQACFRVEEVDFSVNDQM